MDMIQRQRDHMTTQEQRRLDEAEQRLQVARDRAEYHGWNGSSSRAYTEALADVRAARKALAAAHRETRRAEARQETEGFGAVGWAILSAAILLSALAAYLLIIAAHGGM